MTGFKRIRLRKGRRPGRAAASENFIAASQDAHPDDGGDGRELRGQCIIHGTGGVQHGVGHVLLALVHHVLDVQADTIHRRNDAAQDMIESVKLLRVFYRQYILHILDRYFLSI